MFQTTNQLTMRYEPHGYRFEVFQQFQVQEKKRPPKTIDKSTPIEIVVIHMHINQQVSIAWCSLYPFIVVIISNMFFPLQLPTK